MNIVCALAVFYNRSLESGKGKRRNKMNENVSKHIPYDFFTWYLMPGKVWKQAVTRKNSDLGNNKPRDLNQKFFRRSANNFAKRNNCQPDILHYTKGKNISTFKPNLDSEGWNILVIRTAISSRRHRSKIADEIIYSKELG